jgi:hypothetical protein
MRITFLPVLFAVAGAALAQDQVKVGNQLKNATGTVVRLVPGDIACYLEMKDERGRSFQESAEFEICSQKPSLVGKRVALKYGIGKVQSASCQGDPACKKSDTIVLVQSASIIGAAAPAAAKPAAAPAQASHCTPAETVVFSCATGSRIASVCASRQVSPTAGYVQYRFGKPGDPLEMSLPEGQVHPRKAAYGEAVPFAGGGGAWMRFRNGPTGYVVYSGIGKWGPGGATAEKAGVAVEKNGKRTATVKCVGKAVGELGPDWFGKAGIERNPKEDFLFPD